MVHLKTSEELLKRCEFIKDKGAFYMGSIAPDAIMFRKGCKREDKALTHFCTGNDKWGYYTNYEAWKENLYCNIKKYVGNVNEDFLFGYFSHIYTDIENTRQFWTPTRLKNDETYMNTYIKDCDEVDSVLMGYMWNIEDTWSLLEGATKYSLKNLFSVDDTKELLNVMKNVMYVNRQSNPEYIPSIFTVEATTKFVEQVVDKISVDFKKVFKGI